MRQWKGCLSQLPIGRCQSPLILSIAIAPRPLPTCRCPSDVARQQLPIGHCPSAVARRLLTVGRCPSAVARRPLPISHHPSAIAHRLLPIGPYQSAVAHWPLPVGRCPSAIAHSPLLICRCPSPLTVAVYPSPLSFVKRNFLWRWDSEAIFFLLSFVIIFSWRWDSETFFSFCLLSTWRRELGDGTVWHFFVVFLSSSISCRCCQKKLSHDFRTQQHLSSP